MVGKCFFECVRAGDAITVQWKNDSDTFLWRFKADDHLEAVALVFAQALDPELKISRLEARAIQEKMRRMADPKLHRRAMARAVTEGSIWKRVLLMVGLWRCN